MFQDVQGTGDGIGAVGIARPEQDPAVSTHRERAVGRPPWINRNRAISRGQAVWRLNRTCDAALVPDGFLQPLVERSHAVGLGVDRVVDRQQLPDSANRQTTSRITTRTVAWSSARGPRRR